MKNKTFKYIILNYFFVTNFRNEKSKKRGWDTNIFEQESL